LNEVEGMEDAGTDEIGSLYCGSGRRSLSLESSTRFFKSFTPDLPIIWIGFGFPLLDLVALGVSAPFGNISGTIKP